MGVPISQIVQLSIKESHEKCFFYVAFVMCHKKYYKGDGGGFPQV